MKGPQVDSEWMTVQQFISAQGVGIFEVEMDTDTKATRCNCPVYVKKETCKSTQPRFCIRLLKPAKKFPLLFSAWELILTSFRTI